MPRHIFPGRNKHNSIITIRQDIPIVLTLQWTAEQTKTSVTSKLLTRYRIAQQKTAAQCGINSCTPLTVIASAFITPKDKHGQLVCHNNK